MASTLPAPLLKVLQRGGGGVGHGIVGLLLCILSSAPLANLSKKAASLIAVLITALFALVQRLLRDRRGALAATSDHKQLVLEDANGLRHEVIFLGDRGVGKSSLLSALRSHVPASLKEVGDGGLLSGLGSSLAKGESPSLCHARASSTGATGVRRHVVVVWTSQLADTMKAYAMRWRGTAVSVGGPNVPILIVCNMTDIAPCPLPEMNAMRGTKIPALAVSAARGTNVGALWLLLERSVAATVATPPESPMPARRTAPTRAALAKPLGNVTASASVASLASAASTAPSLAPSRAPNSPPPPTRPLAADAIAADAGLGGWSSGRPRSKSDGAPPPHPLEAVLKPFALNEDIGASSPSPASIISLPGVSSVEQDCDGLQPGLAPPAHPLKGVPMRKATSFELDGPTSCRRRGVAAAEL